MFSYYQKLNLSLIPIRPGEKRPVEFGWEKYCDRTPTPEEAQRWDQGNFGYGLALGPASGLLALDIDSDDTKILELCKKSPVVKRGNKGETRFFQYCSQIESTKVAGCIDVLARGRQTVLPPSIHPSTGKPYFWITQYTLENYAVGNLPTFTNQDLSELRSALEPHSFPKASSNWRQAVTQKIMDGSRNTTVTSIVGGLLRSGLHPKDVFEYAKYLNATKIVPPLETSELQTVMMSLMKRELNRKKRGICEV